MVSGCVLNTPASRVKVYRDVWIFMKRLRLSAIDVCPQILLWVISVGCWNACGDTFEEIVDTSSSLEVFSDQLHTLSLRFTLDEGTWANVRQEYALGVTIREVESKLVVRHEWVDYLIERSSLGVSEGWDGSDQINVEFDDISTINSLRALEPIQLYSGFYELQFYFWRHH